MAAPTFPTRQADDNSPSRTGSGSACTWDRWSNSVPGCPKKLKYSNYVTGKHPGYTSIPYPKSTPFVGGVLSIWNKIRQTPGSSLEQALIGYRVMQCYMIRCVSQHRHLTLLNFAKGLAWPSYFSKQTSDSANVRGCTFRSCLPKASSHVHPSLPQCLQSVLPWCT